MKRTALLVPAAALLTAGPLVAGCGDSSRYEYTRPPVDEISGKDRGLQSKDVVAASEQMAMDLFSNPRLNSSPEGWLLVVGNFENRTQTARFDLDIFLQRLENRLYDMSEGRIELIENRDKLYDLRDSELDGAGPDPFGQGVGGVAQAPRIQPRYILTGTARDLPNRNTNYYNLEFTITDFSTGIKVWSDMYEVRTTR